MSRVRGVLAVAGALGIVTTAVAGWSFGWALRAMITRTPGPNHPARGACPCRTGTITLLDIHITHGGDIYCWWECKVCGNGGVDTTDRWGVAR